MSIEFVKKIQECFVTVFYSRILLFWLVQSFQKWNMILSFFFSWTTVRKDNWWISGDAFDNYLQEDFNDVDGGAPVTSQPTPGQGTSSTESIPMPGPNPTNPFHPATEQTSLNTSEQASYTPGK